MSPHCTHYVHLVSDRVSSEAILLKTEMDGCRPGLTETALVQTDRGLETCRDAEMPDQTQDITLHPASDWERITESGCLFLFWMQPTFPEPRWQFVLASKKERERFIEACPVLVGMGECCCVVVKDEEIIKVVVVYT